MTQGIHPLEHLLLRRWGWKQEPPITTVPQLARYFGVSSTTVYKWFGGKARPEVTTLEEIAEKTGLPMQELLEAAGYSTPPDPDRAFNLVIDAVRSDSAIEERERGAMIRELERLRRLHKGDTNNLQLAAC